MEETKINCEHCNNEIEKNAEKFSYRNGYICSMCMDEHFYHCGDCENIYRNSTGQENSNGDMVCVSCFEENYFTCDNCNSVYHNDNYGHDGVCESCESDEQESNDITRHYKNLPELMGTAHGSIIKSLRGFGAELETNFSDYDERDDTAEKLPGSLGISFDGSIHGDYGIEFQTPKIAGDRGEKYITDICEKINNGGGFIDKSCGYHLHIDMPETAEGQYRSLAKIKALWSFYLTFEDVLLSFLPKSRRNNSYCYPLRTDYHLKEIENCASREQIERLWYRARTQNEVIRCKGETKHGSRYKGINFHTLLSGNHLEIRYHSGTINARKVLEWANINLRIVERAIEGDYQYQFFANEMREIDMQKKTEQFFNILRLEKSSEDYFRTRQQSFANTKTLYSIAPETLADTQSIIGDEITENICVE